MLTATTIRRLDMLEILSKQGKRINGLFRLMENPVIWKQAYANIYANKGAITKGVSKETLDGMSEERISHIIKMLKEDTYRFQPVRRVHIPKSNGKTRPLGIPSGNDKLVQEVARMLLTKIYEPIFSKSSHGFRNGRSCHTALTEVRQKWTSVKWVINMDIKGFFDNINHGKLIEILGKRIEDKRFISLIYSMLKAGYIEDWKFQDTYSGTPQGGIISPILANVYLHELDEFVHDIANNFDKGTRRAANKLYKQTSYEIESCMKKIDQLKISGDKTLIKEWMNKLKTLKTQRKESKSSDPMDTNYRRMYYIRYADDFLISIIGTKEEAKTVMQNVTDYVNNTLQLEIAADKSDIVHASSGVRFLGYDIKTYTGNREVKTTRYGRKTSTFSVSERMQLHIPQEKLQKFCANKGYGNYYENDSIHKKFLTNLSEAEIISTYNAEMRGIANYYNIATNAKRDLSKLYNIWKSSLLKTLATKRRSTVCKVIKSLRRNDKLVFAVKGEHKYHEIPLFALKDLQKEVVTYQSIDRPPFTWHFTLGRTELIQRLEAKRCEYCGTTRGTMEVHHIRQMADIANGKELWQIMMSSRQRKTLVLCRECHKKLHSGKL